MKLALLILLTFQGFGGWGDQEILEGAVGYDESRLQARTQQPKTPGPESRETEWSQHLATQMQGVPEYRLPDGSRVDITTHTHAWEVEWPEKWAQAIGQAVFYEAATGKQGGVILLVGRKPYKQELVYYLRCLVACQRAHLELLTVPVAQTTE